MIMTYSLKQLVSNFEKNYKKYKKNTYNEYSTRDEFIDQLLKLLNWDVYNQKGIDPSQREVIRENLSSQGNRPDYTFTVRGVSKFFIEAKKPSVDILLDPDPALQARRYGHTSKHNIVVLTNFENLMIFDATVRPQEEDTAKTALLKVYNYTDYEDKWEEIYSYLSRDEVFSGSFDEKFSTLKSNRDTPQIDEYLIKLINKWRLALASDLYDRHPDYSLTYINDITQRFINQIIFLRICEDRNLPTYHRLNETIEDPAEINKKILETLKVADKKYNSGIFSNTEIILDLDNEIISSIVEELYFPSSPYKFNLIDANLLGNIYEVFLSERLTVSTNNEIVLSKKTENLNRDVVSTPYEVVKYMVSKSLEPLCSDKNPTEIMDIKVVDMACGSGVFILEAYEYLVNHVKKWYLNNDRTHLIEGQDERYFLPFEEKKKILTSCIYGLDIDANAVEVAKFSLGLKLLEDETAPSIQDNSLIPKFENNIKIGNALVDFKHLQRRKINDDEKIKINAFNWNFGGVEKFDAIIGNPPYVKTSDMITMLSADEVRVYEQNYESSYKQYDKYMLFIERAIQKLNENGTICFIVPNKFSKIEAGQKLRKLLSDNKYVSEFVDFGSAQLFKEKNVTIYSSVLLVTKKENEHFIFEEVDDLNDWWANMDVTGNPKRVTLDSQILSENPWVLVASEDKAELINKLYSNATLLGEEIDGVKLVELFNGIQTSAERPVPIYWFGQDEIKRDLDGIIEIERNGILYKIEKDILKPFFKPTKKSEKNLDSYDRVLPNKWIIFPYDKEGNLIEKLKMESDFPETWKYLKNNYTRLVPKQVTGEKKGRDVPHANSDTWYHYGRIQALTKFIDTPKIIVGILTRKPLYLFDDHNMLIASGGTAGYCAIAAHTNSPYSLEFIQAVLNHPAIEWLCSIIGSDFDNGFYSRGTSVLEKLPIINVNFDDKAQVEHYNNIVNWTNDIYTKTKQLQNPAIDLSKRNALKNEIDYLKSEIQDEVSELYGIKELISLISY
ncbi:Eco57I restriction-modification methylase domain-containing protein [Mesobacillus selenatarsenatis]|uniref:site-specific DNA-methyltransferase (adenine-specific) n=1 Tax=Mesobacillus selenatarsenatis TaxID=388741 RepID=A0A846TGW0_9BACI|nr:N-6 DNA methylase [Mesobacillus selenatarsenatis]NKE04657.1 N-6 DNA methylase [Mesobacillus selenatarsenatis]